MPEDYLASIDMKLSAVIAMLVRGLPDDKLKGTDILLRRGGLSTAEIAAVLGKSQRAVQAALKDQGNAE